MQTRLFQRTFIEKYIEEKQINADQLSKYRITDQIIKSSTVTDIVNRQKDSITIKNVNVDEPVEKDRRTSGLQLQITYSLKVFGNQELLHCYLKSWKERFKEMPLVESVENSKIEYVFNVDSKSQIESKVKGVYESVSLIKTLCSEINEFLNSKNIDDKIIGSFEKNIATRKELLE